MVTRLTFFGHPPLPFSPCMGRRLDPKEERLRKREAEQARIEALEKQMQWGRG